MVQRNRGLRVSEMERVARNGRGSPMGVISLTHEKLEEQREAHTKERGISRTRRDEIHVYAIVICAGGSWLGSGTDGPGTMMVRTPSCMSVITFSTYLTR